MSEHGPGPDWTCPCGYDYFGGSAAYSRLLLDSHLASPSARIRRWPMTRLLPASVAALVFWAIFAYPVYMTVTTTNDDLACLVTVAMAGLLLFAFCILYRTHE